MLSGVTVGGDGAAHLSEDLSLGNEAAANEGNIPATGCPLAPHTQTLAVSISMLRVTESCFHEGCSSIGPDEPEALKIPASLYSFVAILKRPFNYTTLRKSSLFVRK